MNLSICICLFEWTVGLLSQLVTLPKLRLAHPHSLCLSWCLSFNLSNLRSPCCVYRRLPWRRVLPGRIPVCRPCFQCRSATGACRTEGNRTQSCVSSSTHTQHTNTHPCSPPGPSQNWHKASDQVSLKTETHPHPTTQTHKHRHTHTQHAHEHTFLVPYRLSSSLSWAFSKRWSTLDAPFWTRFHIM